MLPRESRQGWRWRDCGDHVAAVARDGDTRRVTGSRAPETKHKPIYRFGKEKLMPKNISAMVVAGKDTAARVFGGRDEVKFRERERECV